MSDRFTSNPVDVLAEIFASDPGISPEALGDLARHLDMPVCSSCGAPFGTCHHAAATVLTALRSHTFTWSDERDLQDGIAAALSHHGIPFEREANIGAGERIDFLVGTVGIEVKIKGSLADLTRQCSRYAQQSGISSLIVVTGRRRLEGLPSSLCGKRIDVVSLWRSSL